MNKREYTEKHAHLTRQLASMTHVVRTYAVTFARTEGVSEQVGDAWNAAHDAVTALTAQIQNLESEFRWQKVDPNTRALIAANID